ncbi:MAG TPA: nickel-type superoxide dismutase maturation protease [Acidimicrobiales bacterium]|nr:nickel-type superoxide dismutase maturation protease [Acidimicrobiales bacterium]
MPGGAAGAVLAAGAVAVSLAVLVRRVEVVGASMAPTLLPGDRLVVLRLAPVRAGAVVALPDPRHPSRVLVKRVAAVGASGVDVRGDAVGASTDSRHFGLVARRSIVGRAVWRYAPPERAGRLRPAGPGGVPPAPGGSIR